MKKVDLKVSITETIENTVRMVSSTHDFLTPKDRETSMGMKSYGLEQIAFALLTEAIRREAYLQFLIQQVENPNFLKSYTELEEEDAEIFVAKFAKTLTKALSNNVENMAEQVTKEILEMAISQRNLP